MPRSSLSRVLPVAAVVLATCPGVVFSQDVGPSTSPTQQASPTPFVPPSAFAAGGAVDLIFTNIPGFPESNVPGMPGVTFKPGTGTANFDRVYGSPNGNWILTGLADLAIAEDELVLVPGAVVQQEGQPAPWTSGVENCGTIDQRCDINDAGDITFATNTDGPTTADDYIVTRIAGTWGASAREGDAIAPLAGNVYDDLIDSPLLLADGTSGFSADGIDGTVTATEDDVLILGATLLMQEGVTVPSGQAAGGAEFIENFDLGDFWASEDGAHWLVQGDLTGATATDDVVIVDGAVVLQEGSAIAGSGFVDPVDADGIVGVHMDAGGNWYARGNNDVTEQDWVVRNGAVVATLGDPIVAGGTEVWDDAAFGDCFFLHVGNSSGSYVIGGVTDNPDILRNGVLVLNGTTEVCREGDPIDLDGNGMFDDDAFANTFGNDDGHLADDGRFFVVLSIKDSTGAVRGQGFLVIDTGGTLGVNYCAASLNSTGSTGVISATGSIFAANNDITLTASALPTGAFGFFITSQTQGFVAMPNGSAGNLCVLGTIGRYVGAGQIQNTGVAGEFSLTIDLTLTPQPTGLVSVASGETWNFQAWHRDVVAGSITSNFTDGLEITFQ